MKIFQLSFLLLILCTALGLAEPEVEIKVLEQGMGPEIVLGQEATISYRLKLTDGTLIDQALPTKPFPFILGSNSVIKGFNQGVEGMKVGEQRTLTIPPELAYGSQSVGLIPENSSLVFEVELLEIKETGPKPTESAEAIPLSQQFRNESFLANRHASGLQKPAMFEYLIRDFFTKPWRYEDGHLKIWRATGRVCLALLLTFGLALFGRKKGWWVL